MFSFVISNAPLYTTEEMVASKFLQLGLGEFTIRIRESQSSGKQCLKIFLNYTSMTEESAPFRRKLIENSLAQKANQPYKPVRIVYDSYNGKEKYWNVFLAKTPLELETERAEHASKLAQFKVRIDMSSQKADDSN